MSSDLTMSETYRPIAAAASAGSVLLVGRPWATQPTPAPVMDPEPMPTASAAPPPPAQDFVDANVTHPTSHTFGNASGDQEWGTFSECADTIPPATEKPGLDSFVPADHFMPSLQDIEMWRAMADLVHLVRSVKG